MAQYGCCRKCGAATWRAGSICFDCEENATASGFEMAMFLIWFMPAICAFVAWRWW